MSTPTQDRAALERWVAGLPAPEKNDLLMRVLDGKEGQIGIELRNRFEQGRPQAKAYAEAVQMLLDLREITARRHAVSDFDRRLAEIRAAHAKKRAFIERLVENGL